jgi:hypothetical protein
MAKEKSNPPIKKLEDGSLRVAIWQRVTDKGAFHSITHERGYFDKKKDEWCSTTNLGEDDILPMIELYSQAYREIKRLRGIHMKKPTLDEAA